MSIKFSNGYFNFKSYQLKMMFITFVLLLCLIMQSIMMIHSFIHSYKENLKYYCYNNIKYHHKNYPSSIYSNRNNNQIPIKRSKISINNINNTNNNRSNSKQQQIYTSLTKYEDQSIKSWSITDSFNSTTLKLLFDIKVK